MGRDCPECGGDWADAGSGEVAVVGGMEVCLRAIGSAEAKQPVQLGAADQKQECVCVWEGG